MPKIILGFYVIVFSTAAFAIDPIFTPWQNNLAIRGYDTVAYFTEAKAIEGNKQFEYSWQGATWRFSSDENKQLFIEDPQAYAPQYGGYCAYAVAENSTASVDPTQFSVVDGKLYLNYNKKIQAKWLAQQADYIRQADLNWPALLSR